MIEKAASRSLRRAPPDGDRSAGCRLLKEAYQPVGMQSRRVSHAGKHRALITTSFRSAYCRRHESRWRLRQSLPPPGVGVYSDDSTERTAEMCLVAHADLQRNLSKREIRVQHELLSSHHTAPLY